MADATQALDDFEEDIHQPNSSTNHRITVPTVAYLDYITSTDGHIHESFELKVGRNLIGRVPKSGASDKADADADADADEDGELVHKIQIDRTSISLEHAEIIIQEYMPPKGVITLPSHVHRIDPSSLTSASSTSDLLVDLSTLLLIDLKSTNKTHLSEDLQHLGIRCQPRIPKVVKHGQYVSFGDAKFRLRIIGMDKDEKVGANDSTASSAPTDEATLPYDEPDTTLAYGGSDDLYGSAGSAPSNFSAEPTLAHVDDDDRVPSPIPPPSPLPASPTSPRVRPSPANEATQAYIAADEDEHDDIVSATNAATLVFDADAVDSSATQAYGMVDTSTADVADSDVGATLAYPVSPTLSVSSLTSTSQSKSKPPSPSVTPSNPLPPAAMPVEVASAPTRPSIQDQAPVTEPLLPDKPSDPTPIDGSPLATASLPPEDRSQPFNSIDDGPGASHNTPPPSSPPRQTTTLSLLPPTPSQPQLPSSHHKTQRATLSTLPSPPQSSPSSQFTTPHAVAAAAAAAPANSVAPCSSDHDDSLNLVLDFDSVEGSDHQPQDANRTALTPPSVPLGTLAMVSPTVESASSSSQPSTSDAATGAVHESLTSTHPTRRQDSDGDEEMTDAGDHIVADPSAATDPLPSTESSSSSSSSISSKPIPSWHRRKRADVHDSHEDGTSPSTSPSPASTESVPPTRRTRSSLSQAEQTPAEASPSTAAAATPTAAIAVTEPDTVSSIRSKNLQLKQSKFAQKAAEKARKDEERKRLKELEQERLAKSNEEDAMEIDQGSAAVAAPIESSSSSSTVALDPSESKIPALVTRRGRSAVGVNGNTAKIEAEIQPVAAATSVSQTEKEIATAKKNSPPAAARSTRRSSSALEPAAVPQSDTTSSVSESKLPADSQPQTHRQRLRRGTSLTETTPPPQPESATSATTASSSSPLQQQPARRSKRATPPLPPSPPSADAATTADAPAPVPEIVPAHSDGPSDAAPSTTDSADTPQTRSTRQRGQAEAPIELQSSATTASTPAPPTTATPSSSSSSSVPSATLMKNDSTAWVAEPTRTRSTRMTGRGVGKRKKEENEVVEESKDAAMEVDHQETTKKDDTEKHNHADAKKPSTSDAATASSSSTPPKKTRRAGASAVSPPSHTAASSSSTSSSSSHDVATPQITLTGVLPNTVMEGADVDVLAASIDRLGGHLLTDDISSSTHLLTDAVRRTEKFLTAYASPCKVRKYFSQCGR